MLLILRHLCSRSPAHTLTLYLLFVNTLVRKRETLSAESIAWKFLFGAIESVSLYVFHKYVQGIRASDFGQRLYKLINNDLFSALFLM